VPKDPLPQNWGGSIVRYTPRKFSRKFTLSDRNISAETLSGSNFSRVSILLAKSEDSLHASKTDLIAFLQAKLLGSSLKVIPASETEMHIEAGDILALAVREESKRKVVDFSLFSKTLNRFVTIEEINGTTFMETKLAEELEKEDRMVVGEDILLAVDLLRIWAAENGYSLTNEGVQDRAPKTGPK